MLAVKLPQVRSDSHYFYSLSIGKNKPRGLPRSKKTGKCSTEPQEDVGECGQSLYHSMSHQQVIKAL